MEPDAKGSGLTGIVALALREQLPRKQIVKLKVFDGDFITHKGVCQLTAGKQLIEKDHLEYGEYPFWALKDTKALV